MPAGVQRRVNKHRPTLRQFGSDAAKGFVGKHDDIEAAERLTCVVRPVPFPEAIAESRRRVDESVPGEGLHGSARSGERGFGALREPVGFPSGSAREPFSRILRDLLTCCRLIEGIECEYGR
ncbi:hypothetical protein [Streptomyces sp. NPDC056921]|uniref:hypothetical protein n=1 Tax=Streptomyces sp. NPDC056921 TaxID=3345966 RepID=UPI003629C893